MRRALHMCTWDLVLSNGLAGWRADREAGCWALGLALSVPGSCNQGNVSIVLPFPAPACAPPRPLPPSAFRPPAPPPTATSHAGRVKRAGNATKNELLVYLLLGEAFNLCDSASNNNILILLYPFCITRRWLLRWGSSRGKWARPAPAPVAFEPATPAAERRKHAPPVTLPPHAHMHLHILTCFLFHNFISYLVAKIFLIHYLMGISVGKKKTWS